MGAGVTIGLILSKSKTTGGHIDAASITNELMSLELPVAACLENSNLIHRSGARPGPSGVDHLRGHAKVSFPREPVRARQAPVRLRKPALA